MTSPLATCRKERIMSGYGAPHQMTLKIPALVVPCIVVHFRAKQGQLQICLAVLSLGLQHTQQHHHGWKRPPLDGTWLRSAAIR